MTNRELRLLVSKHISTIDTVMDVFTKNGVEPEEGEALLCWMVGMSVGLRQGSLTGQEHILQIMAQGFQYAAEFGQ